MLLSLFKTGIEVFDNQIVSISLLSKGLEVELLRILEAQVSSVLFFIIVHESFTLN